MLKICHWNINTATGWVAISTLSGFFALKFIAIDYWPIQCVGFLLSAVCGLSALAGVVVLLVLVFRANEGRPFDGGRSNEHGR